MEVVDGIKMHNQNQNTGLVVCIHLFIIVIHLLFLATTTYSGTMSQSPLARQSRKSLSAFSRAPSQLSKGTTRGDLLDSPSPSTGSSSSSPPSEKKTQTEDAALQNAFATPTRKPRFRHSTIGVGSSTPRTPLTPTRIIYSPYATPPAPLSKSSSIPFDMATNLRAAAKAEENKRMRSSLGGAETPKDKKKRFVRQKSLWKR